MKNNGILFAALALGGVGVYFFLKNQPASGRSAGISTTGTAGINPNPFGAFASLFGRGQPSTVNSSNQGASSSISAAIGPVTQLLGKAIDKIWGAGRGNNTGGVGNPSIPNSTWSGGYPATPADAYTEADAYAGSNYLWSYPGSGGSGSGNDTVADSYHAAVADSYDSEGGLRIE